MAEEIVTSALRSFTTLRKLARGNLFITFVEVTNLRSLVSKVFLIEGRLELSLSVHWGNVSAFKFSCLFTA